MSSSVAEQTEVTPGTVITSTEMMAGLPAGAVLDLNADGVALEKWERAAQGGWVCIYRNGANVPLAQRVSPISETYFSGLMGGQLRVAAPPIPAFEPGMALAVGEYTYVVDTLNPDGTAHVGAFRGDRWVGPDSVQPQFLQRADVRQVPIAERQRDTWVPHVLGYGHRQVQAMTGERDRWQTRAREFERERDVAQREVRRLTAEVTTLREQAASLPAEAIRRLHGYAREVDDETFDDLLGALSIPRKESIVVTVQISGVNYVTANPDEVASRLGITTAQVTDIEEASRVTWTKTFDVTREVDGSDCACEDVSDDDDDVRSQVPADAQDVQIESCRCKNG